MWIVCADVDSDDSALNLGAIAKRLAMENIKLKRELKAQNSAAKAKGKAAAAPAVAKEAPSGSAATSALSTVQVQPTGSTAVHRAS